MKLIKLTTPKGSILSIDISDFKEVKLIEKGILEVVFNDKEKSFLIEGSNSNLEEVIDYIIDEKNKYEEKFYSKKEVEKFLDELSEKITKETISVIKQNAYKDVVKKIESISKKAENDLSIVKNYNSKIKTTTGELNQIEEKIKEIKKELF